MQSLSELLEEYASLKAMVARLEAEGYPESAGQAAEQAERVKARFAKRWQETYNALNALYIAEEMGGLAISSASGVLAWRFLVKHWLGKDD